MNPSSPAVEFQNVCKQYEASRVLDQVDLTVHSGSIFCLLGRNGAGKTTALHLLMGLRKPSSGRILIHGIDTTSKEIHAIRRTIGYLPEDPVLYAHLTGREFLRFIGELYGIDADAYARVERVTKRLRMENDVDSLIATYSLGMKKKLSLIAALASDPSILVLDEPTGGLDAVSAREVKAIMRDYRNRDRLVLFTTHVLEVAERLADRIGILHAGRLRFDGSIRAFRASYGRNQGEAFEDIFVRVTESFGEIQQGVVQSNPASR